MPLYKKKMFFSKANILTRGLSVYLFVCVSICVWTENEVGRRLKKEIKQKLTISKSKKDFKAQSIDQ